MLNALAEPTSQKAGLGEGEVAAAERGRVGKTSAYRCAFCKHLKLVQFGKW